MRLPCWDTNDGEEEYAKKDIVEVRKEEDCGANVYIGGHHTAAEALQLARHGDHANTSLVHMQQQSNA